MTREALANVAGALRVSVQTAQTSLKSVVYMDSCSSSVPSAVVSGKSSALSMGDEIPAIPAVP